MDPPDEHETGSNELRQRETQSRFERAAARRTTKISSFRLANDFLMPILPEMM